MQLLVNAIVSSSNLRVQAFCALFFATFSLAQANVQFPDIGKAQKAAERVFSVIDRTPEIDIDSQVSLLMTETTAAWTA